jgi:hypothetical protein
LQRIRRSARLLGGCVAHQHALLRIRDKGWVGEVLKERRQGGEDLSPPRPGEPGGTRQQASRCDQERRR